MSRARLAPAGGPTDDGAIVNIYGVGGCPTTVFANAGGKVVDTKLGNLTEEQLRRQAGRLLGPCSSR